MFIPPFFNDDYIDDNSIEKYFSEKFKIDIKNKTLREVNDEIDDFISKILVSEQPTFALHSRVHKYALNEYARNRILFYSAFRDEQKYIELVRKFEESKSVKKESILSNPAENQKSNAVFEGGRITLCEFSDFNTNINSYAYFENEDFVVDYWMLGSSYENEYFITIKKDRLVELLYSFHIINNNRDKLLLTIAKNFSGKDCFKNFEAHLKSNKIKYDLSVRHDEK